jgi:hypothetical protein
MSTPPAQRPGRRWAAGTPTRLRIALVVVVLAGMTFGGGGFVTLRARADALADARAESRVEVTVQTVRTRLFAATRARRPTSCSGRNGRPSGDASTATR